MSERFTLYRGESGAPHVAVSLPPSGDTAFAVWVEGDCIRCMYHGGCSTAPGNAWEQPAEDKSFAAKIRIGNCPTRGILGWIFAYFGGERSAAFPRYPLWKRTAFSKYCRRKSGLAIFSSASTKRRHLSRAVRPSRRLLGLFGKQSRRTAGDFKEESPWGTTAYASFAQGWRNVFQFSCPTPTLFAIPRLEPECGAEDRHAVGRAVSRTSSLGIPPAPVAAHR